jgi:hypothetical protein
MTPEEAHEMRQGQEMLLLRQELALLERATAGVAAHTREVAQTVTVLLAALGQPTEGDPRTIRHLLIELIERLGDARQGGADVRASETESAGG